MILTRIIREELAMKTHALVLPMIFLSGWLSPGVVSAQSDTEPGNRAQSVSLSGRLNVLFGDPPADSGLPPERVILLFDEEGNVTELLLDEKLLVPDGGLLALNGRQVTVIGERADLSGRQVRVDSIAPAEDEGLGIPDRAAGGLSGAQPWVTILCRFSDSTGTTPETKSWFQTLLGGSYPGMNHFWREVSYDNINLSGSVVVGWYNLPNPRSYYVYDMDSDGDLELDGARAVVDCAAVADADVFFPNFVGINMMFNQTLDCCAWGGGVSNLTLDGETRNYSATWMPPWGFRKHSTLGQEMGHGFGLPHSSGPYSATYDSKWDVMSAGGMCSAPHAEYTCLGVHTVAYHKNKLGWIPGTRRFTRYSDDPVARTMTIERMAFPPANSNYLMAELVTDWFMVLGLRVPTEWYTIESRRRIGYDNEIPGDAVVIHEVVLGRDRPAQVVDEDGAGDPNDDGARWLPGENFYDAANGVQVYIESETSTGYVVSITTSPRSSTYVDPVNTGAEDGSSANPWNTVRKGYVGVIPGGTIYGAPGNYSETMTIRKPLVLRRWGSSGSVVIGE